MEKVFIETSSFPLPADKLKKAVAWWNGQRPTSQHTLVKQYKLVTWADVVKAWEIESHK